MDQRARVGSLAPEFDLPSTVASGRSRLADYRGRWLVLVFYPRDFSLVCPTELSALSARIEEFNRRGAGVLGVSADTLESHRKWIDTPVAQGGLGGLSFPLASDTDGTAAEAYGVFLESQHMALRGLFVIDANGVLQYEVVHNLSVGRRSDEVLRVLDALQTGGLCAENWSPGEKTLDRRPQIGPGSTVSHYRIEAVVGRGTFSTVYRASDTTLERPVALKVLKTDSPDSVAAALVEARSAAALNHPNICTVYAVDESEGVPLIAMEYLDGKSLARWIESGELTLELALDSARQIAEALSFAHASGVVHGDLKPANVYLTSQGQVKLLDFGLSQREHAKRAPEDTTELLSPHDGTVSGTPAYMAPEQARGEPATKESDVFAFGSTLFEMVTRRRAFAGANVLRILSQIREVRPDAMAAQTPEPVRSILCLTMEPERRQRKTSMAEIVDLLTAAEAGGRALEGVADE